MNSTHGFALVEHTIQNLFRNVITKDMQETLSTRLDNLKAILATFPAGCRCVTPLRLPGSLGGRECRIYQQRDQGLHPQWNRDNRWQSPRIQCNYMRHRIRLLFPSAIPPSIGRNEIHLHDRFIDSPRPNSPLRSMVSQIR